MQDDPAQIRPVGALVQALRILRHLGDQGRAEGVSTIARACDVNGSTCYNILRTLVAEGLVVFDPQSKTYRLGLGLVELAVGVLGANPADLIRPELERLALVHGALTCLWHLVEGDRAVLIERAYGPETVRVDIPKGKRLPPLIGGVGRVVAAKRNLTRAELQQGFAKLRWQNQPDFDRYFASVADAGRLGYGLDIGELYTGVDVVGAVITDGNGVPRYGLSTVTLSGQTTEHSRAEIGRDLVETCDRIGRSLFRLPAFAEGQSTQISPKSA